MNKFMVTSSVLILTFLVSIFSGFAYATEASSDTETALEVEPIINISAPSTVTLNCTPGATNASAELCTNTASINVTTNNVTGYTLQMNATSGSSNSLTNTAVSPSATIPTLSQAYTSANFPVNYWGYTGGLDKSSESGGYNCASNYCPVLAYQSNDSNYAPNHVIKVTNAPATTSAITVTFAGKVNIDKPSGTYTTSVTFTAVTNYVPGPISNGMNMQDIGSASCALTPLYSESNTTYTVVDARDNEEYMIAKLADGNCWMLDNLRLDITDSTVLNSLTTSNTNADVASLTSLKSGNRAASARYASSGFEIWDYSHNTNAFNRAKANAGFKDTTTTSYGIGSGKIGVYYNYCAASAGNYCYDESADVDEPNTLQDAQYDICPKSWRLPTSTSNGEFQALYTAYSSDATIFRNALSTPFSGDFTNGGVYGRGEYGYFWSSTWSTTNKAYRLLVYSTQDSPSYSGSRDRGSAIRCLVRDQ